MDNAHMLRRMLSKLERWLAGSPFQGSRQYWIDRYEAGRTSGAGSYNELAEFKAEIINAFVARHGVDSVMEFGCGDGHQLGLARYPAYTGFDISPRAVDMCRKLFATDASKRFSLMDEYRGQRAELVLSLDVIYHLVEDSVFESYMRTLFAAADRFVIIYSSNSAMREQDQAAHVRHRVFSDWVDANAPGWTLMEHIPNKHPPGEAGARGSLADFFVYEKRP